MLPSWSFEPFPFLDLSVSSVDFSVNMLLGITFSAAPESNCSGDFVPRPLSSSVSCDQVIQSSRLLFFVVLGKMVECWSWINSPSPHLVILFLLWQRHTPSSSGVSKLASYSAYSSSGSLSHNEPWSSSSSFLLVHWYGQFIPICPCSPQS